MTTWKNVRSDRQLLLRFAVVATGLAVALVAYTHFLTRVEQRQGVAFLDPLHVLFTPVDLTWVTFSMVYGAVLGASVLVMREPLALLWAMQAYTMHTLLRMMMMWALPLDPPITTIPLIDPVVSAVTSGGAPLTRDLFYSGHVGTLVVLSVVVPEQWARRTLLVLAALVGVAVLLQHVHYTVDVLVAPIVAATAARLTRTSA
jgi:hypothetical protein